MGRFVAIGGGTFEDTDALTRRIVELSHKEIPNVVFIGTAAEDSTNPLTSCKKSFKRVCPGTVVKKLSIIRNTYTEAEVDEMLSWADIIYVGPGNTEFMLEKWREYGLFEKLRKIFEDDSAVLSGISAGAICWFEMGYTDSDFFTGADEWSYRMIHPGFSFFPAVFCPHYGDWKRGGFDAEAEEEWKQSMLRDGKEKSGNLENSHKCDGIRPENGEELFFAVALEDCTAFIFDNGAVSFAKSRDDAKAFVFYEEAGQFLKREVSM